MRALPPGALGGLSKQWGFTKRARLLRLGKALEGQAGQAASPRSTSDFLWTWRRGASTGTHPCTHPVHASEAPTLVQSGPSRPLSSQAHVGLRCTQSHPEFHTLAHVRTHTHRAERETSGLRQGGFSAVVAQQREEEARPLLGRDPVRERARGRCQGPAAPPQGTGLPGHLTLLVPSRTRCLPPLLHAAPEGSVGHTIAQRGGGGPVGAPGRVPRTLANPRPAGASPAPCRVAVAVEGPEMEDWAAAAEPVGGWRGREGKLLRTEIFVPFLVPNIEWIKICKTGGAPWPPQPRTPMSPPSPRVTKVCPGLACWTKFPPPGK